MRKVYNVKENVIPAKRSASGNLMRCPVKRGMTESGRSMVEMLGVLAVIGVLSVAGIAGYSIAMRSYRTNEIVNAASMLHVLAMAQNAGNGPTANVAYTGVGGTNPSGVSTLEYNKDTKSISITFTDPNDCTMALNKLGDKASGTCPSITVNFGGTTTTTVEPEPTPISEGDSCEGYEGKFTCRGNGYIYWCYEGAWQEYDSFCIADWETFAHEPCLSHDIANSPSALCNDVGP